MRRKTKYKQDKNLCYDVFSGSFWIWNISVCEKYFFFKKSNYLWNLLEILNSRLKHVIHFQLNKKMDEAMTISQHIFKINYM